MISDSLPTHIKKLRGLVDSVDIQGVMNQWRIAANCSAHRLNDMVYQIELSAKKGDIFNKKQMLCYWGSTTVRVMRGHFVLNILGLLFCYRLSIFINDKHSP
ncbi:MAG: hypothetical protein HQK73_11845 [Desulfamplus sp.]|nr:hypothetical protein [Desulfamplus sp.]